MLTFKQLEAVFWVAQLGGFAQAAQKLHTTQSAISKRVQELEALFDTPLFDRTLRTARLTAKGEEMVAIARRLLEQRDGAVQQFSKPQVTERLLRIGVTELTAMTWLPRWVSLLKKDHPGLLIQPSVSDSQDLRESLLADEVDLIVVPEAYIDNRFTHRKVGNVENAWMAKPGLLPQRESRRLHDLSTQTILTQGPRSGTGLAFRQWAQRTGFQPDKTIVSNNLLAIIGMTVSGLGVSHLPRNCLQPMIETGLLEVLKVTPALPDVAYYAAHKQEQRSTWISSVALLAGESCDFNRSFQLPLQVSGA